MKKHDDFEIWLHDDQELSVIRGTPPASRKPLRAWPLSVVEQIVFDDGTSLIYKAYRNLPVENAFYQKVQSQHIPKLFYDHSDGDRHWLLLEDVPGHHPAGSDREQTRNLANRARRIINAFSPVESVRYDLSEKGYGIFVDSTAALLRKLSLEGKLKTVDATVLARFKNTLSHPEVLHAVHGRRALLHGDLKCDNLIIRPDGEMIMIDWQNILYGPEEIDTYSLMASRGMDPVPIAGIGPEILRMALEIRWFATCMDRWLPYHDFYDGKIAHIETCMRHLIQNNGYADREVYRFG